VLSAPKSRQSFLHLHYTLNQISTVASNRLLKMQLANRCCRRTSPHKSNSSLSWSSLRQLRGGSTDNISLFVSTTRSPQLRATAPTASLVYVARQHSFLFSITLNFLTCHLPTTSSAALTYAAASVMRVRPRWQKLLQNHQQCQQTPLTALFRSLHFRSSKSIRKQPFVCRSDHCHCNDYVRCCFL